jgi:hypothetical protein
MGLHRWPDQSIAALFAVRHKGEDTFNLTADNLYLEPKSRNPKYREAVEEIMGKQAADEWFAKADAKVAKAEKYMNPETRKEAEQEMTQEQGQHGRKLKREMAKMQTRLDGMA